MRGEGRCCKVGGVAREAANVDMGRGRELQERQHRGVGRPNTYKTSRGVGEEDERETHIKIF
jgi:hypothetical protein